MFKKSLLATTILAGLSFSVSAEYQHIDGIEPIGNVKVPVTKQVQIKPSAYAKASTQSQNQSASDQCTATEFASLASSQVTDYLLRNGTDCFNFLFGSASVPDIFSSSNIDAVVSSAIDRAGSYDGTTTDNRLFLYLRAAYYQNFYSAITLTDNQKADIEAAIDAYVAVPGFMSIDQAEHGQMMYELISAMDGASNWGKYYDFVKEFIGTVSQYRIDTYGYSAAFNGVTHFLFRGQVNARDTFGANVLGQDPELAGLLADFALNPITADAQGGILVTNYINQLGNLLEFDGVIDSVKTAVQRIIDANERLSQHWMMMVTAIDRYDTVECTEFTGDVCANDALRAEIEALAFPNTFEFDGGNMVFHTSLSREEIEQIAYQLKETEAAFFKVTGATDPVAGDVNDVAIFRIYGSMQEYNTYQTFLYDLPSNNGGIYIERDATLYTWDREEWESAFTLEELARHEYVHYLVSRYLIPGYWGETEMYQDQRVTWVDEGLANFIAGGTQYEGVNPLPSMVNWVGESDSHYTPAQAVATTYSDQLMYPYSALMFNYLFDQQSEFIDQLVTVLRNDDVAGYDALRNQIGGLSGTDFGNYINSLAANVDSLENPWKDYLPENKLWFTDAADVEWELQTDFADIVDNVSCSDMSTTQFGCDMTINFTVTNNDLPLYDLHMAVDSVVSELVTTSNGNLETANCYVTTVGADQHDVRCEGGLRRADVDYVPDNTAPIADDSEFTMNEDETYTGTVTATDPEGDSITYTITVQPSNGTIQFDTATGDYAYTPNADFFGSDEFRFVANDGELDSNEAAVSITVVDVEEPNTAPVANDIEASVTEGDTVSANLSASDADGDSLRFIIDSQPSSGDLTVNEDTGAFEYTPSISSGTVTFTYYVTDGKDSSNTATVTITVNADNTNTGGTGGTGGTTTTPTTSSTSDSSGGGGSVGIFGLLLGLLAVGRRFK